MRRLFPHVLVVAILFAPVAAAIPVDPPTKAPNMGPVLCEVTHTSGDCDNAFELIPYLVCRLAPAWCGEGSTEPIPPWVSEPLLP